MELHFVLKFVHVVCAILWVGGGTTMILLGALVARDDRIGVVRLVTLLANRLFVPASVVVLLTGLGMVWNGSMGWPAWIIGGLSGIAFTALFGSFVLGPMATRAVAAADGGDPATALTLSNRLLRLARFDYCVQFGIVWLMVQRPVWGDLWLLALPLALVGLGAALFLRPGRVDA